MEELVVKAKGIALKNAEQLAKELVADVAFPALKMAVEKSENKIDDVVLAALEAPLKAAVLELVEKIYVEAKV